MNSFIKYLMDEKNLKQRELAEILGISSAAISQWNEDGTNIKAKRSGNTLNSIIELKFIKARN